MTWWNWLSTAGQTHENLTSICFLPLANCEIVHSCSLPLCINYKFMCLSTYWLVIKISQWVCENFCSCHKMFTFTILYLTHWPSKLFLAIQYILIVYMVRVVIEFWVTCSLVLHTHNKLLLCGYEQVLQVTALNDRAPRIMSRILWSVTFNYGTTTWIFLTLSSHEYRLVFLYTLASTS